VSKVAVLVHGLFSSGKTWDSLKFSISKDTELQDLEVVTFEYSTPRIRISPMRVIPDQEDVALKLWTFTQDVMRTADEVALIAHSQGGLIVQRMLVQQLQAGEARSLTPIKVVVLLACPNSGSDLFLTLRRGAFFWRHPQERALRPLDKELEAVRTSLLNRVVHARVLSSTSAPIPIFAYAGESDGMVGSQSALSGFPNRGILDGDHFGILNFSAIDGLNYSTIRAVLLDSLKSEGHSPLKSNSSPPSQELIPRIPRPLQLPRSTLNLFGRNEEVSTLRTALAGAPNSGLSVVIVVSGKGGIGKTALAVKAASSCYDLFPDGVLFADLGGGKDASAVQAKFLTALGVSPEILRNPDIDLLGLYRSVMSSRKVLAILDNVDSAAQVEALIPPTQGSAAVITARKRLTTLECNLRINLQPLSRHASEDLLWSYIRAVEPAREIDKTAVHDLAGTCGDWPIVLHLAGASLARHGLSNIHSLISRLGSETIILDTLRGSETEIRIVIRDSVQALTPSARRTFSGLGIAPGAAASEWLVPLAGGKGTITASSNIEELLEANLLEIDTCATSARYRMHDLVRDTAKELAEEDRTMAYDALKEMVRGYLTRAALIRKVLELDRPPFGNVHSSLTTDEETLLREIGDPENWFERERNELIAAVKTAAEHGLYAMAIGLANTLPTYFIIRGTWNEWGECYEVAIRCAEESGDNAGRGYLLQGLANINRTKGLGTGIELIERSSEAFEQAGEPLGRAYVMNDIGLIRMYEGRWSESEDLLLQSATELRALGHPVMALQPLRNHAISMLERGMVREAAFELSSVCGEMRRLGDVRWWAYSQADLGKALMLLGETDSAMASLRSSIETMMSLGDLRWTAATRIRLGDLLRAMGHPDEANREYAEALRVFSNQSDSLWASRAAVSLAMAALDMGNYAEAKELCDQAMESFVTLEARVDQCRCWVGLHRIHDAMGTMDSSVNDMRMAEALAQELGRGPELIQGFLDDTGVDVR
jgi:tetratricopeptide (TPR) repeat protein/pimeloyl-ACP methyl ester carboxylesterase